MGLNLGDDFSLMEGNLFSPKFFHLDIIIDSSLVNCWPSSPISSSFAWDEFGGFGQVAVSLYKLHSLAILALYPLRDVDLQQNYELLRTTRFQSTQNT